MEWQVAANVKAQDALSAPKTPRPSRKKKPASSSGPTSLTVYSPYWRRRSTNAVGIRHLMMRNPKTGRLERITGDAEQIDRAIKKDGAFWIYTKEPNVQAFTDLMNRAIDKPAEHVQVAGEGGPMVIRWPANETLESPGRDPNPNDERDDSNEKGQHQAGNNMSIYGVAW